MRCVEFVCVTASPAEREVVIAALAPFCDEPDVDVRIYRHEMHPTDLAVHLTHRDEVDEHADVLGERIATLLETHGLISRAPWREVAAADKGARP